LKITFQIGIPPLPLQKARSMSLEVLISKFITTVAKEHISTEAPITP